MVHIDFDNTQYCNYLYLANYMTSIETAHPPKEGYPVVISQFTQLYLKIRSSDIRSPNPYFEKHTLLFC